MNVQDRTRLPWAWAIETWLDKTIFLDLRRPRSCGCGLRLGDTAHGGDGCLHGRRPRGLTLQALDGRLRRYGPVPDLLADCDGFRAVRATPSGPAEQRARYTTLETMAYLSVRRSWTPGPIPDLPHSHDQLASRRPLIRQAAPEMAAIFMASDTTQWDTIAQSG